MKRWRGVCSHSASNIAEVKAFILSGKDVNAKDECHSTLLHYAKTSKYAQMLINAGADVNAKDVWNSTPLHYRKTKKAVQVLINAGACVNARDNYGGTPLHSASASGNAETVKALIAAGADVDATDICDKTPLLYSKNTTIVIILINAGADMCFKQHEYNMPLVPTIDIDSWCPTPLHYSCCRNVIDALFDITADIRARSVRLIYRDYLSIYLKCANILIYSGAKIGCYSGTLARYEKILLICARGMHISQTRAQFYMSTVLKYCV